MIVIAVISSFLYFFRYEDDPIVGHRLYREIRRVETKNTKAKGTSSTPSTSLQWETVATNLDEFQEVSVSFSIFLLPISSVFSRLYQHI